MILNIGIAGVLLAVFLNTQPYLYFYMVYWSFRFMADKCNTNNNNALYTVLIILFIVSYLL